MKRTIQLLMLIALISATLYITKYKENTKTSSIDLSVYAKSDMFITAEEAIELIGKKDVMFVSGDSSDLYVNFHIRGSVVMDAHTMHISDKGVMKCSPFYQCVEDAEVLLSHKGISNDTLVIAYDNYKGSNSTGVYSFLKSYGHKNVKMLMGGFKAIIALDEAAQEFAALKTELKAAKLPLKLIKNVEKYTKKLAKSEKKGDAEGIAKNTKKLAKAKEKAKDISDFEKTSAKAKEDIKIIQSKMDEVSTRLLVTKSRKLTSEEQKLDHHDQIALLEKDEGVHHANYKISKTDTSAIASKADVFKAMKDIQLNKEKSPFMILDARSKDEFSGKTKGTGVTRGGHIPGATFLEWTEVVDEERMVTLKTPEELTKIFKAKGISKDKIIYTYCLVGAGRGSHIATALEAMGYANVKVYTGSWDEWGNNKDLPLAK